MSNTTILANVAREIPDVNPREGWAVVVFEQLGDDGREFRAVLQPGERFPVKKGRFLSPAPSYVAYAVTKDENLRLEFTRRITHNGQADEFDLTFNVSYLVDNPRTLAEHLNSDPLKRLQDEIKQAVERAVFGMDWSWIEKHFQQVEEEVLGEDSRVLKRIKEFAASLGISIVSIEMRRWLVGDPVELGLLQKKAEADKKRREIEHGVRLRERELDEELEDHQLERAQSRRAIEQKHERELREAKIRTERELRHQEHELESQEEIHKLKAQYERKLLESFTTAVGTLAEETGNADDFIRNADAVLRTIRGVFAQKGLLSGEKAGGEDALLGGASGAQVRGLLPASAGGLARVLVEAFEQISKLDCTRAERNTLLSAVLHLLAELLLDADDRDEEIRAYGDKVKEVTVKLRKYMSPEQFQSMRRFQDYEALKDYIQDLE
jgi:hypothetical protein